MNTIKLENLKSILETHPTTALKKEISKTNIKGYSKLKKNDVISLMLKHPDRFIHLQTAIKKERAVGAIKVQKFNKLKTDWLDSMKWVETDSKLFTVNSILEKMKKKGNKLKDVKNIMSQLNEFINKKYDETTKKKDNMIDYKLDVLKRKFEKTEEKDILDKSRTYVKNRDTMSEKIDEAFKLWKPK